MGQAPGNHKAETVRVREGNRVIGGVAGTDLSEAGVSGHPRQGSARADPPRPRAWIDLSRSYFPYVLGQANQAVRVN